MTQYKIPVIAGDGIGPEVINEGKKVIDFVGEKYGFDVSWIEYPFGAEYYLKTNKLLDENDLKELGKYKAIYLGAVGDPRVAPGILEQEILLKMRFYFDQYVNLRPVKLLPGIDCPIVGKKPEDIDMCFVRENTEDFYMSAGGHVINPQAHEKTKKGKESKTKAQRTIEIKRELYSVKFDLDIETDADEIAFQIGMVSKKGTERVMKYAFDLAEKRRKRVASVDKVNVLSYIYGSWRNTFENVSAKYPEIETEHNYADALAMRLIRDPESFDVIVTPNMFGDILTDLGAVLQGGLGLSPGANINPNGTSMFEPIHGSAPTLKGKNEANPIATIWSGALMLEQIGEKDAANDILNAIMKVLEERKIRTADIGGKSKCSEVGDEILKIIKRDN
ncbi:MAG: isocitrate/isopropylmalate dehydrogenase family protein [Methanosarcinaceae archaeon]|nr:isocitrate/isopropylmalate dehydrogenase family protein [Methanosarcinaceae archaeon]